MIFSIVLPQWIKLIAVLLIILKYLNNLICLGYFIDLIVLNVTFLFCLDALAACNYLPQSREKIIAALFKALNSTNNELQEAGEACMRKVSATSLILFLLCPFLL